MVARSIRLDAEQQYSRKKAGGGWFVTHILRAARVARRMLRLSLKARRAHHLISDFPAGLFKGAARKRMTAFQRPPVSTMLS